MSDSLVITSAKKFSSWIRDIQGGETALYFGKIISSPRALVVCKRQESHEWGRLVELSLPSPRTATMWWADLWEGEIVDCRCFSIGRFKVICISKSAIWNALPQVHMLNPKEEFSVITENDIRKMVGNKVTREMFSEVHKLGISIRTVNV